MRKPRKVQAPVAAPQEPLPPDQTNPPVDTNPPEPQPETKPSDRFAGLTIETF